MTDIQQVTSKRQTIKLDVTRIALIVAMVFTLAPAAIAQDKETKSEDDKQPKVEMLTCKVLILDPDGHPVEGATVFCVQMSAKIRGSSSWTWNPKVHGPRPRLTTNENGIVEMPYPKYVSKNLETGEINLLVDHPDFIKFREHRSVSDDPAEITLARGFRIAVTGVIHSGFDRPTGGIGRSVEVDLKPVAVAELNIKMQKKGTDVLDANDSNDEGLNNDKF